MLLVASLAADAVSIATVTRILMMTKVPAKSRSLRIAEFDTWAQSTASGYKCLPFTVMCCLLQYIYLVTD